MRGPFRIAAVQPPVPAGQQDYDVTVQRGIQLAKEGMGRGADLVGLPEYFGVYGLPPAVWKERVASGDPVLDRARDLARDAGVAILCPSVEPEGERLYNTTWMIDERGGIAGKYRKVHLTLDERCTKGITAGGGYPVVALKGIQVGVMTCYDGYFPEAARILALAGAQVIFFPSLQRAATAETVSLQVRSRALDNCVYVVRSSYGYPRSLAWQPGMMVGMTCASDWDGRMVGNLGPDEGVLIVDIPRDGPRPRLRSYEGGPEAPRSYLLEDRRPDTYGPIAADPGGI